METKQSDCVTNLECGTSLAELEHVLGILEEGKQEGEGIPSPTLERPSFPFVEKSDAPNSVTELRERLANDLIGGVKLFTSPFEAPPSSPDRFLQVPLIYCDQTASNRPLQSIEAYLLQNSLPLYGNTHTNTSLTGSQSTAFCAEARQIVAESCNAKTTGKASLDVVLFAGNGTTSAVELFIDCLGLKHCATASNSSNQNTQRPVVFVGPYEHHSNLLPWREAGCEVVMVPESAETHNVDLHALSTLLQQHHNSPLKLGTFTAASNLTGKLSDTDAIAAVLHQHGALALFDYATAAPYVKIDMNPPPSEEFPLASQIAKDAVFISPHKMVGGVATPGILIVKKHLVHQINPPARSGGGTVFYVTHTHHRFLSSRIERYEGGTPNIVGIQRAGLAFLRKRQLERDYRQLTRGISMLDHEFNTYKHVVQELQKRAPNLVLLGDSSQQPGLPIFSFLIRSGRRFLHYNFVCALLNDVFGIQSRGGCQCSGPYAQHLLGLTKTEEENGITVELPNAVNEQLEQVLVNDKAEVMRPGFTRLSLPFKGLRESEIDYVVDALCWIAKHGWAFMCLYRCNHKTGEWRHYLRQGKPLGRTERKWLSNYDSTVAKPSLGPSLSISDNISSILKQTMENADKLLQHAKTDRQSIAQAVKMSATEEGLWDGLRWYILPKECASWLTQGLEVPPDTFGDEILGALKPRAVHNDQWLEVTPSSDSNTIQCSSLTTIVNASSRKRKTMEIKEEREGESTITQEKATNALLHFREDEHAGEATLAEIETGFDDGELSEKCSIFDANLDAWVPIKEFLQNRKPKGMAPSQDVMETSSGNVSKEVSHRVCLVQDDKNQKKKPPRNSSQWGKAQPISVSAVPHQVDSQQSCEESGHIVSIPEVPKAFLKKRGKGVKPPAKMMRLITQAMIQWNMVEEGDRLLLGLSGGKDSLSLLHCLLDFQRKLPLKFEIEVCTIDPMTPSFDPSPLIPYVESIGLKYHYIRDDIVERANKSGRDGSTVSSLCAFCARMKRGNLYTCARRNQCNKLVLAQHLDDCAESFFMSVMHNGFLRTMKANYKINAGDISVIRPMVYCRESLMTEFAKAANLPVINENCPACFEEPKERARIKKLLTREETLYPNFYDNLKRSLIPLMHEDATAILRCYTEETVARSRKENHKKVKPFTRTNGDASVKETENDDSANQVHAEKRTALTLAEASEEDLIRELSRRKAEQFRLSGAMGRMEEEDDAHLPPDPTGQVCTLNGGQGSIPCRELME
jgi:selenocysteine lyase/cysteine desulfurase/tRNA(Ile)-lysidine synthase TilS/MesJ